MKKHFIGLGLSYFLHSRDGEGAAWWSKDGKEDWEGEGAKVIHVA